MGLQENYNFDFLVNEAERMVLEELEHQLDSEKNKKICTCEECVLDMAALALNRLKPMYRASLMGTLYAHSLQESEYGEDVRNAVEEAISKVAKNPAHD
ncbi:MAG TPA: competence protein ComFB [Sediminispirochaeta sp.]|nr:competence protein ComFB [Sediminispirochaeta sp.]